MTGQQIQQNNYFEYRNISEENYKEANLPLWIQYEIKEKNVHILDYGCGFGQNLIALENAGFINIYGVDIEKSAMNFCINKGLNVKELDISNLKNPFLIKFDIIILSHIIEHIPKNEVINTLIIIKNEFLEKRGKLLISVPNAQSNTDCYWAYEDWTHTTLFTSGSLHYVLKAAGFDKIDFLDTDCTLGGSKIKSILKRFLLKIYKANRNFWNKVTSSAYHQPSPQIFSYEIKVKAE
ncbi:class I SAM-dependent methyltransferase [Sulfuricurvum sp.]|uniref:class I SAM-dependent methyltransferase n=1 Tax=Sulfuricurvum sp. TaxID=2025608 RepID=UPI003567DD20